MELSCGGMVGEEGVLTLHCEKKNLVKLSNIFFFYNFKVHGPLTFGRCPQLGISEK